MTTYVDIVNRALQDIGTRTTIASLSENSNEAIQANLVLQKTLDELVRMAPWNCATNWANLTYISSLPGTPENSSSAELLWSKGLPAPPWVYEYQYPVDCLRPLWIVPAFMTGFTGTPITTAVTGGGLIAYNGPPMKFKVGIDQFYPVTAATKVAGGTGYVVGDIITLPYGASGSTPIGAPVQLQVATLSGSAVATVTVVPQVLNSSPAQGGSYFAVQTGTIAQDTTTGVGTGATFTLTFGAQASQRVILTNQENATLCYLKQVLDPNLLDPECEQAWVAALGARLAFQLTGDIPTANAKLAEANAFITKARASDGNEGLTVNDVTPDWIRGRGIYLPSDMVGNFSQFDWGGLFVQY